MILKSLTVVLLFLFSVGCNLSDEGIEQPDDNNMTKECVEDNCGVCDTDPDNDCTADCSGTYGGDAVEDNCGVCDDDPTNDCTADCAGNFDGDALEDECGVCDEDPSNDCMQDCAGDWGGDAVEDNCGVCDNDPTNDCEMDCNGDFGGTAIMDGCGRCVEGMTGLDACPSVILPVEIDAHVTAIDPAINRGTDLEVIVDKDVETYLRFDLSSLPPTAVIRSAKITMVAFDGEAKGGNGQVFMSFVPDDQWEETRIVWDNKPAASADMLGSWTVTYPSTEEQPVELASDALLDILNAQVWGDRMVSLQLTSPGYRSRYFSKESTDADKRPQLEVSYQITTEAAHEPIADAYVDSRSPITNFGAKSDLKIQSEDRPNRQRIFMMFKLDVPAGASVERVSLEALAFEGYAYGGDGNVYGHFVADDSWTEDSITWDNAPMEDADALGFWWLWYNGEVRDQLGLMTSDLLKTKIIEEIAGDGIVSIRLHSPGYRTTYRSREYNDASQRPRLRVFYIPAD